MSAGVLISGSVRHAPVASIFTVVDGASRKGNTWRSSSILMSAAMLSNFVRGLTMRTRNLDEDDADANRVLADAEEYLRRGEGPG